MKKILFISYYELKDYLLHMSVLFAEQYKWEVCNYPLFMYAYDQYSKIDNYQEHLTDYINTEKPDVILWWFIDVPLTVFSRVRSQFPNIYYIMYNSDDPTNMNKIVLEKAKKFDMVLTPCKHSVNFYKNHSSAPNVYFLPMGFEGEIFKPYHGSQTMWSKSDLETYACDISFVCDSVYKGFTDQFIPRKKLIEDVIAASKKNGWVFHLYGSSQLGKSYPDNYKGEISYIELPKLFNSSKINLCTHSTYKRKLNVNQYVLPVMACGGLLLVDKVRKIDKFLTHSDGQMGGIILDRQRYIDQIGGILSQYRNSDPKIQQIRQTAQLVAAPYSWNNFIKNIYIMYNKHVFDPIAYKKNHALSDTTATFPQWLAKLDQGVLEYPYRLSVPPDFNENEYKYDQGLKNVTTEYAFAHWILHGKNMDYMTHKNSSQYKLSGKKIKTFTPLVFDLFRGFNMVYYYDQIDAGLDQIIHLSAQTPQLDINLALSSYFDAIAVD